MGSFVFHKGNFVYEELCLVWGVANKWQFNPSACFVGLDSFMIFQNNHTVQQKMSTTSIPRFSLVNVLFFISLLPLSSFFFDQ